MSAIKNIKIETSNRNERTEKVKPKTGTKIKRMKKGDENDPLVTTISELLSTSVSIISPEGKSNAIVIDIDSKSDDSDMFIENPNGLSGRKRFIDNSTNSNENLQFGETFKVKIARSSKKKTKSCKNDNVPESSDNGSTPKHKQSECKNAFQLLMDSRHKVIGRNSPGKCLEEQENDSVGENKQKLRVRKQLLEDWTVAKGSEKRQREEIEKELYINKQLGNRAKKLKKLLSCDDAIEINTRKSRKRVPKIESDDEESSANDVITNINNIKRKRVRKIESDSDDEDLSSNELPAAKATDSDSGEKMVINLVDSPEINCKSKNGVDNETQTKKCMQKGLLKFFNLLVGEKLEDIIGDEKRKANRLNVNKINKSEKYASKKTKSKNDDCSLDKGDEIARQSKKRFKTGHVKGKRDMNNSNQHQLEGVSKNIELEKTLTSKIVRKRGRPKKLQQHDAIIIKNTNLEKTSTKSLKMRKNVTDSTQSDLSTEKIVNFEPRKSLRKCTMKPVNYAERSGVSIAGLKAQTDFSDDSNDCIKKISKSGGKKHVYVEVVHVDDDAKSIKMAPIFMKTTPRPKLDPSALEARNNFLRSGVPDSLRRKMEKQHTAEDVEYDVFPSISHVQQKNETPSDLWCLPKSNLKLAEIVVELPRLRTMRRGSVTARCDDERKGSSARPPDKIRNLKSILNDIKTKNPKYPVNKTFRLLSKKVKNNENNDRFEVDVDVDVEFTMLWTEKYKPKNNDEIFGNQSGTSQLKKWLHSWLEYSEEVPSKTKTKRRDSSSSEFESDEFDDTKEPKNTVILAGPHGSGKTMTVYALCNEMGINVLELNASEKRTGKRLHQELQEATQSHQVRDNTTNGFSTKNHNGHQENDESRRKMCVLLVDDIDVVFDQDEGFLSVLSQLLTTSKRPIILVTTDKNCVHLQKFVAQYSVINFFPLSPQVLTVWLQIVCLLEGLKVERDSISEILEWNQGDVRKTLLQLQFWVTSGRSESESESRNLNSQVVSHSNCTFVNPPFDLDKLWWNVPNTLKFSPTTSTKKDHNFADLKSVSEIFDSFSMMDVVRRKLGQQTFEFEHGKMKHSLELGECMDDYSPHDELAEDWMSYLLKGRGNFNDVNLGLPSSKTQRWCSKQRSCGENFLEIVPYSYHTDHRGVALDYFSSLRNMSRDEMHRSTTNSKRRNRFSSYLRTIGLNLNEATNKTACNVFNKNSQNMQFFD